MTTINSFGEFQASVIVSEERLKYLKNTDIEIINCEPYDCPSISSVIKDYKAFLITFKVTSTTFVYFMNAGIDYSMDKYIKR
jgi:hypothetical protein